MVAKSKSKKLQKIREQWAKGIDRERDFTKNGRLFRLNRNSQNELVDDTTWSDLNMDNLFAKMDRTQTPLGSQYLYKELRTYKSDEKQLQEQYQFYCLLAKETNLREKIQLQLSAFKGRNLYYLADFIFSEIPERPRWYPIIYLLSSAALISLLLIYFYPVVLWLAIALVLTNIIIEQLFGKRVGTYINDITSLSKLFRTAQKLSRIQSSKKIAALEELLENRSFVQKLLAKIGWLTIDTTQINELSASFIEYLNHFCLFNLVAFLRSVKFIKHNQQKIQRIFNLVASVDAAISLASYLEENPKHCNPQFTDNNKIELQMVSHPLLEEAVSNSIKLVDTSVLITGSNMAGKTTFIKSIAVNTLLAQTVYFAFAEKIVIPKLIVKTSIKRSDDLSAHKSYYFNEIEALLDFINLSKGGQKYLFVIDEIYRGTNTIERVAAATAVLKHLAQQNFTLVTTHDIELQELLAGKFEMYHFSEQVQNGNFYFDYKLQSGPCTSGNAIKLLELKGYPQQVTEEARQVAGRFLEHTSRVKIGLKENEK